MQTMPCKHQILTHVFVPYGGHPRPSGRREHFVQELKTLRSSQGARRSGMTTFVSAMKRADGAYMYLSMHVVHGGGTVPALGHVPPGPRDEATSSSVTLGFIIRQNWTRCSRRPNISCPPFLGERRPICRLLNDKRAKGIKRGMYPRAQIGYRGTCRAARGQSSRASRRRCRTRQTRGLERLQGACANLRSPYPSG
jgi:hypothetical protein